MQPITSITIIGSGSWSTALVKVFSECKVDVTWHMRSREMVNFLLAEGRNNKYLSHVKLDMQYIHPTCMYEESIGASGDILFSVPSAFLEETIMEISEYGYANKNIYVSIKGLAGEKYMTPSAFVAKYLGKAQQDVMVLAGPCHAEEIAMGNKTYMTIAGKNEEAVLRLKTTIHSPYIQVITNKDPTGVELTGILKNIISISTGIASGLNYGDNFLSVVVSNAMREIRDFLMAADPLERDLFESAYFGDLLATAYSSLSRNRSFGHMIGRGYSVPVAVSRMNMVAEGFTAVRGIFEMANQIGVKMPVIATVYRILHQQALPYLEFKTLEQHLK
jgi:glycerol-3-phosphate dehydrogenase (NAD(P)+)